MHILVRSCLTEAALSEAYKLLGLCNLVYAIGVTRKYVDNLVYNLKLITILYPYAHRIGSIYADHITLSNSVHGVSTFS